MVAPLRGAEWEEVSEWGGAPEGIVGSQPLPACLSWLPGHREVNRPHTPTMMCRCATTGPKRGQETIE